MAWIWLVLAGLLEVVFALFLKLSAGFTKPVFTLGFILAAGISFFCLTKAMQTIPMGTAYTVWIGIGAVGVVLLGIIRFDEPVTAVRLMLMVMLITSIVGLQITAQT